MRRLIILATLSVSLANALGQTATKLLPFQGRLTDQNGVAVSNSVRLVQFKIYDVPTGGSPVWAGELHRTTVNGGLVNVLLGSKTPLSGVDFDKQLYLEITVDVSGPTGQPDNAITAADPPMLPRQAILPVVFAKEAADSRLLDGYDWSALFGTNNPANGTLLDSKIRDASISATKLLPASITSIQIGAAAVTGGNIAPSTLSSNNIIAGTIDYSVLAQQVIEALNPAGAIVAFGGDTNQIPPGWLLCDGRPVSSLRYPRLYTALSTNWGAGILGSTNNFNVPDLRGVFLRGVNGSRSDLFADPGDNRTGAGVGSFQSDEFRSHQHATPSSQLTLSPWGYETAGSELLGGYANNQDWPQKALTQGRGGSETRPKNAYVNYIIKY